MNLRIACLVVMVAACDKKPAASSHKAGAQPAPETPVAADPACAAKVKELEPWLAKLQLEKNSDEIDFGPKLALLDREPMPVPTHIDAVEIRKGSIEAWDIGEHDHASTRLAEHATPEQLAEFLTKMHDRKASADEYQPAPDDLLRVDVDVAAPWSDVTHVIDAATTAGYHQVVLAFKATSKLAPPPGVDDTTKTVAAAEAASDQLEALRKQCKPLGNVPAAHRRSEVATDDAASYAKETAAAFLACNCAPDPDAYRKLVWADVRWHQAVPRVGVVLALDGTATTTVTMPAKTPWSDAYPKILEATGPVKLAAK